MKAVALLPILFAAGCGGQTTDPDAQPTASGVALPAAGAADAVRTAKPGTAPVPGAAPSPSPSRTPAASAAP